MAAEKGRVPEYLWVDAAPAAPVRALLAQVGRARPARRLVLAHPLRRGLASVSVLVGLAVGLGLSPRPAHSTAVDFATARKATDAFARQSDPGARLWRVDATVSSAGGAPEVSEYVFHYLYQHRGGPGLMALSLAPTGVGHARGKLSNVSMEPWQETPVPQSIRDPQAIARALQQEIPRTATRIGAGRGDQQSAFTGMRLIYAGAELAGGGRNQLQWSMLSRTMGPSVGDVQFFARTAPSGRWIWWTAVEQDRADPRADPRRAGTPGRVKQYVYADALSGKVESHCLGRMSGPLPCEAGAAAAQATETSPAPSPAPRAGGAWPAPPSPPPLSASTPVPPPPPGGRRVLMATGRVTSSSPGRLVIVTDRDASTTLRSGTELSFLVNLPHLRAIRLQSGDRVAIHYEQRGSQLLATEIRLRPPE